jgi:hypothetical protein
MMIDQEGGNGQVSILDDYRAAVLTEPLDNFRPATGAGCRCNGVTVMALPESCINTECLVEPVNNYLDPFRAHDAQRLGSRASRPGLQQ